MGLTGELVQSDGSRVESDIFNKINSKNRKRFRRRAIVGGLVGAVAALVAAGVYYSITDRNNITPFDENRSNQTSETQVTQSHPKIPKDPRLRFDLNPDANNGFECYLIDTKRGSSVYCNLPDHNKELTYKNMGEFINTLRSKGFRELADDFSNQYDDYFR